MQDSEQHELICNALRFLLIQALLSEQGCTTTTTQQSNQQIVSPMLSNTAFLTSLFSSLYTDAILRKASAVFEASDTSTYTQRKRETFTDGPSCFMHRVNTGYTLTSELECH